MDVDELKPMDALQLLAKWKGYGLLTPSPVFRITFSVMSCAMSCFSFSTFLLCFPAGYVSVH